MDNDLKIDMSEFGLMLKSTNPSAGWIFFGKEENGRRKLQRKASGTGTEKYKENFIPTGFKSGAKEDYLFKLAKIY